jgi:hypothetical protein
VRHSLREMGLPRALSEPHRHALHIFRSRAYASESAEVMARITGEYVRVRPAGGRGTWVLERFNGTEWVRG